jgi:hypothetical protein
MFKSQSFTALMPGKFYHVRPWISKNASYAFFHGEEEHVLTNPEPPTNIVVGNRTSLGYSNCTWTNGTCFEVGSTTAIFKHPTAAISDPDDPANQQYKIWEGTGTWANLSLGAESCYLSFFSNITRTEDGTTLTEYSLSGPANYTTAGELAYNVKILREKKLWGLATMPAAPNYCTIEFLTKDGVTNYMNASVTLNSFSVLCDKSDLVTFRFWYGSFESNITWIERNHLIPETNLSSDRNVNIYIPNVPAGFGSTKGEAKPVTIFLQDRTYGKFSVAKYAKCWILANGSKTFTGTEIHSDYVQADYGIRTYLVVGDQYAFYAESDDLARVRLGSLIIFDDTYNIDVTETSIENVSWQSIISLVPNWNGNNLRAWLNDSTSGLSRVIFHVFDKNGNAIDNHTYTGSNCWKILYTYGTGDANRSMYYANVVMKYDKGTTHWNSSAWIFWNAETSGIEVDMPALDRMLNATIGPSPVYINTDSGEVTIPYTTLIMAGIVVMMFFVFRPEHVGFAIIFIGSVLAILRLIGMVTEALLPSLTIVTIILIGVLVFLILRGGTGQTVETYVEKGTDRIITYKAPKGLSSGIQKRKKSGGFGFKRRKI